MKRVLFSGSAPSGILTIGNYIGALKQWKRYAREYDSIFCVVDLHALTVPRDPELLRERSLDFLCLYVACGLDPEKSIVFLQSQNPYHTELSWILNAYTSFGELRRMTQFKDKTSRSKNISAGLLNYPILMAADILLYGTSLVPIGDDQRQHVELARIVARRFNASFGNIFTTPEGFTPQVGGRIRNLQDPTRKMDKSDPNPATYISLLDDADTVYSKIRRAKTDSSGKYDIEDESSGIANMVNIMAALENTPAAKIAGRYAGRGYALFKQDLSEQIIETLKPIQAEYSRIRTDPVLLESMAATGRDKSIEASEDMIRQVRKAVGLVA